MKKEDLIFVPLFIFSISIFCGNNSNSAYINQYNIKKVTAIQDLEILNLPYFVEFPDENDPNWKPIEIPFINKAIPTNFFNWRSFWIRGRFAVDNINAHNPADYYAINLGSVAIFNAVYINKRLINKFEPMEWDRLLRPTSYVLPSDIKLKENNNVYISFLVDREYIILTSDIYMQSQASYNSSQKWVNFIYSQFPVGFAILLTGLIIVLFKNYIIDKNKRHLLYSLYLFSIFLNMLLIYSPTNFLKPAMIGGILSALIPINLILIILVFQAIYGIYLTKQNLISGSLLGLIAVYMFVNSFMLFNFAIGNLIIRYISIPLVLYNLYLIFILNSHKPERFKFILSLSLLVFILLINVVHMLGVYYNIWYQYFYYIYSTPIYAVLVIINEARESRKKRIELKEINSQLKKDNGLDQHTLTISAENKIEKVISFLSENYTSEISREGLASAVDMSPNYMSKLFFIHTGKKINDYINHLRVNDAAKRLKSIDNGKKVIDIALETGFESVSTFNRVFKDNMGISPREYKKKYN